MHRRCAGIIRGHGGARRSRAFSLVELLIVMSIIVIISGAIALGGLSNGTVDGFAEASRLGSSLRSLRSAWLACYAESYYTALRFPDGGRGTFQHDSKPALELARFCDRALDEDTARYGDILIVADDDSLYIGYAGGWKIANADVVATMKRHLAESRTQYYASDLARYASDSGDGILIRIR